MSLRKKKNFVSIFFLRTRSLFIDDRDHYLLDTNKYHHQSSLSIHFFFLFTATGLVITKILFGICISMIQYAQCIQNMFYPYYYFNIKIFNLPLFIYIQFAYIFFIGFLQSTSRSLFFLIVLFV
jgi:hypothetical protein